MEKIFWAALICALLVAIAAKFKSKFKLKQSAGTIYDAFLEISDEARKVCNIAYPGILTSEIAKHAKMSHWKAFKAMSEIERRPDHLVHRMGDRWYPGGGWKQ